jgi:hypothetical protein
VAEAFESTQQKVAAVVGGNQYGNKFGHWVSYLADCSGSDPTRFGGQSRIEYGYASKMRKMCK